MRVALEDLHIFSKCPAFFRFYNLDRTKYGWKPPAPSRRIDIIRSVIQKCYFTQLRGVKPNFRQLMGWVDKQVFKNIDVTSDDQIQKGRDLSESILVPLRGWYDKTFSKEQIETFISVPMEFTLKGHQIHTVVPLIKLQEPVTIMMVDDVVHNQFQLYNNMLARGYAWLASRLLKQDTINVQYLWIGADRASSVTEITCKPEVNKRTETVLLQLADQVATGVNYPSFTSMCNTCTYRKDCIL